MTTYDFIVGIKLGDYHNRTLKYDRVELENDNPREVYKRLGEMVSAVLADAIEITNRNSINQTLRVVESTLAKDVVTEDDLTTVDNCFDVISYLGLEADAFRRDDNVVPTTEYRPVMAFIVNTKADLDERISPAIAIMSNDETAGSINDLVMETFRSRIRLNPTLEAIIKLEAQISNWEMMKKVGASMDMDTSKLRDLLHDMGFEIKVFLN